ncbi:hypothetical protein Tco_0814697 [Tanacetum coccineum]
MEVGGELERLYLDRWSLANNLWEIGGVMFWAGVGFMAGWVAGFKEERIGKMARMPSHLSSLCPLCVVEPFFSINGLESGSLGPSGFITKE